MPRSDSNEFTAHRGVGEEALFCFLSGTSWCLGASQFEGTKPSCVGECASPQPKDV